MKSKRVRKVIYTCAKRYLRLQRGEEENSSREQNNRAAMLNHFKISKNAYSCSNYFSQLAKVLTANWSSPLHRYYCSILEADLLLTVIKTPISEVDYSLLFRPFKLANPIDYYSAYVSYTALEHPGIDTLLNDKASPSDQVVFYDSFNSYDYTDEKDRFNETMYYNPVENIYTESPFSFDIDSSSIYRAHTSLTPSSSEKTSRSLSQESAEEQNKELAPYSPQEESLFLTGLLTGINMFE